MKVSMLLASRTADQADGLLSAIGLGWTVTKSPTPPGAMVITLVLDPDEARVQHQAVLRLLDADGQPVPRDANSRSTGTIGHDFAFDLSTTRDIPGSGVEHTFAIDLGAGMELRTGQAYQWELRIDSEIVATREFSVLR